MISVFLLTFMLVKARAMAVRWVRVKPCDRDKAWLMSAARVNVKAWVSVKSLMQLWCVLGFGHG